MNKVCTDNWLCCIYPLFLKNRRCRFYERLYIFPSDCRCFYERMSTGQAICRRAHFPKSQQRDRLRYWRLDLDRASFQPINGRMDRASATEMIDTGSIPDPIKPNTVKNISVARIFDWGGGPKSNAMRSSEIFENGTFCGTKILYTEKLKAVACVLAHNQNFALGERA